MSLTVLGIIPARGGSKAIPHKNIALLAGKPLINWTIKAAQLSRHVSRVIVSTEDEEIASVARQAGAEVPFLRPIELARDDTPGIAPILHAIGWLETSEGYSPDLVMCLQPTSPLRSSEDIDAAIELAAQKNADAVVSVTPPGHHPAWMRGVDDDGRLRDIIPNDSTPSCRQDLPLVYALNGAIYLVCRKVLREQETWYTDQTYAYVMPPERSLDIDTKWDLHLAGLIMKDMMNDENG